MAPEKSRNQQADTIARDCIAVRMRLLNRVITKIYDEALRPLGVKTSQLNILIVAARREVARPADVCEILQLDTSTLSRNVDRMRARGWIETVPDAEDGRAQPFRLTVEGRKLLKKAAPAWRKAQTKAREILGEDVVDVLDQAVRRLRSDVN